MDDEKKKVLVAYRPGIGDPETTEAYGKRFKAGEFVEIDDEFVSRAKGNPSFEVQGEKSFGDDEAVIQARDDLPNDLDSESDLSFDEGVELERIKEYGTDDPVLAERLRRARGHGRDLSQVSRLEAEAAVKRKPGRPRKDTPPIDDDAKARADKIEADQAEIKRQHEAERDAERQRQERLAAAVEPAK